MADCHRLIRPFESAGAPPHLPARNVFCSPAPKHGCNNPRQVSSCLPSCLHIGNIRPSAGWSLWLQSWRSREASKVGSIRHIVVTINQVTVGRRHGLSLDTLISQSKRYDNRPAPQRRRQRSGLKGSMRSPLVAAPSRNNKIFACCSSFWLISLIASGIRPFALPIDKNGAAKRRPLTNHRPAFHFLF